MTNELLIAILASYIVTDVLVEGTILAGVRGFLRDKAKFLSVGGRFVFDCRMCMGFWVSLFFAVGFSFAWFEFIAVWGGSYWMAAVEQ